MITRGCGKTLGVDIFRTKSSSSRSGTPRSPGTSSKRTVRLGPDRLRRRRHHRHRHLRPHRRGGRETAGPAVALSFVVAGVVCALAALCYAEFASTVPVAGSAYTFSYATLGELLAWIIGWDLMLELALGAAVVAGRLVGVLRRLLDDFGWTCCPRCGRRERRGRLPAVVIVLILTGVLVAGIKLSVAGQPGHRRHQGARWCCSSSSSGCSSSTRPTTRRSSRRRADAGGGRRLEARR